MNALLGRLPDYTCVESIARSRRTPGGNGFQPLDTIRLQVGLIGGRERYTWPDAARFDDRELRDLVGRGIIGTGDFAAHVHHVFLSPATQFTPRAAEAFHNRQAARFDYEVPVEYSRYTLRVGAGEAEVGVRGSFWWDLQTFDLLRLEVYADEIPPELGMSRVSEVIEYARIPIADSNFLLPVSSELSMVALDGMEHRNQITFTECQHFQAASSVHFDADDQTQASRISPKTAVAAALPPSLRIDLTLESDIDPENAALGDSVRASIARPVENAGQLIAPEGAIVHGRLVRLERAEQPFDHYIVGLEFHTLETADGRVDFFATMQDAGPVSGLLRQAKHLDPVFTRKRTRRLDVLVSEKPRGEGILLWDAKHHQIRRGLKMRWVTADPEKVTARGP
ncbi:MAG: hypothetical protein JWO48_549 [Bryobacterales bacterium]|nr:hypothetical protein [Bryobacterales bacterium]